MTPPFRPRIIPAMFALYEALLLLAFLVLLPLFAVVGFLRGKYWPNFRERLGFHRGPGESFDIWIQAVSVGEVAVARALANQLREGRPDLRMLITTTTITGQSLANRLFPEATVTYFPFDFTPSVHRFLQRYRTRMYVAVETEIWPNTARICSRSGARIAIVNGRISDRSFRRYRAIRWILRRIFVLYDVILVRSGADRERFVAIGAPAERVEVTGNLKFDQDVAGENVPSIAADMLALAAGRPIFIAGSTMEGEDEAILPHLPKLIAQGCFVVIAPRKPQRFEIVGGHLATSGLRCIRRSEIGEGFTGEADLLLLDSIGELSRLYRHASAAFVGGSLVPNGGHNPIEPVSGGAPVAFGPHMSNFREIAETFLAEEAAVEVRDATELMAFVSRMIGDEDARQGQIERGQRVIRENRGASRRTAGRLLELLE